MSRPAPRASLTRSSVGVPPRVLLRPVCRGPSPQASHVLARYERHSSDSHSANRHEAEQRLLDRNPEDMAEDDHAPIRSSGVSSPPAANRRSPLLVSACISSAGFAAPAKVFTQRSTRLAAMTFLATGCLRLSWRAALSASRAEHMTAAKVSPGPFRLTQDSYKGDGSDTTPDGASGVSEQVTAQGLCPRLRRVGDAASCSVPVGEVQR